MARLGGAFLLLALLIGCGQTPAPSPEASAGNQGPAAAQSQAPSPTLPVVAAPAAPIPSSLAAVTTALQDTAEAIADAVPAPEPAVVAVPHELVSPRAVRLIVAQEVISEAYYNKRLIVPIWPGGASGVTIGIGADMGYSSERQIRTDWAGHPRINTLAGSAGVTGIRAKNLAKLMQNVLTPFDMAMDVFKSTHLVEFYNLTRRTYPGFDELPFNAQGALVSLTFNRGASMTGDRRLEMRVIRDTCVPNRDVACIAAQLRASERVWKGSDIERGMHNRREAEAVLALTP